MADAELEVMNTVHAALDPLDDQARTRVLSWVAARFELELAAGSPSARPDQGDDATAFEDIADLFNAAQPSTGPQRALVAGYWFQQIRAQSTWTGSDVNTALKNLGSGLANVTTTLNDLKDRKPALVMQVSKTGRSKQSRKTYKLTTAGMNTAKQMLSTAPDEEAS